MLKLLRALPYKNVHFYLLGLWVVLTPITYLTPLKDSIAWTNGMSLYACIETSAAALSASRKPGKGK